MERGGGRGEYSFFTHGRSLPDHRPSYLYTYTMPGRSTLGDGEGYSFVAHPNHMTIANLFRDGRGEGGGKLSNRVTLVDAGKGV